VLSPEQLLERSDESARLLVHARLLMRLDALFAAALPTALAKKARVVNYRQGVVTLHAPNGAIASKLRQLTPRLAEKFSQNGLECNQIEVKVQPVSTRALTPPVPKKKPLTRKSADAIRACADVLPEGSPLAAALQTLLERSEIEESD